MGRAGSSVRRVATSGAEAPDANSRFDQQEPKRAPSVARDRRRPLKAMRCLALPGSDVATCLIEALRPLDRRLPAVLTDPGGRFTFDGVARDEGLLIRIEHAGCTPQRMRLAVTADASGDAH